MTAAEAARILTLLTDGKDPRSGEPLPPGSPTESPEVLRALFVAVRALEAPAPVDKRADRRGAPLPGNAGKAWAAVEEEALVNAFDAVRGIDEIAEAHARTRGSIRARLIRLGRIEPDPIHGATAAPVGDRTEPRS